MIQIVKSLVAAMTVTAIFAQPSVAGEISEFLENNLGDVGSAVADVTHDLTPLVRDGDVVAGTAVGTYFCGEVCGTIGGTLGDQINKRAANEGGFRAAGPTVNYGNLGNAQINDYAYQGIQTHVMGAICWMPYGFVTNWSRTANPQGCLDNATGYFGRIVYQ